MYRLQKQKLFSHLAYRYTALMSIQAYFFTYSLSKLSLAPRDTLCTIQVLNFINICQVLNRLKVMCNTSVVLLLITDDAPTGNNY